MIFSSFLKRRASYHFEAYEFRNLQAFEFFIYRRHCLQIKLEDPKFKKYNLNNISIKVFKHLQLISIKTEFSMPH